MIPELSMIPERAAQNAQAVDSLFVALMWMTAILVIGIALTILFFLGYYNRDSEANREGAPLSSMTLETVWSVIPAIVSVVIFGWSMSIYSELMAPAQSGEDIYVVGKQWMWKFQYPSGHREINSLHVPAGETVRLRMISQDVIHSLYIPAFRLKKDVLPGRYRVLTFEPTEPGTYKLFCAEYCGTEHAQMGGTVTVMEPAEYEKWLREGGGGGGEEQTLAESGAQLFEQKGCVSCHGEGSQVNAPSLEGVYGAEVQLANGETVTADEEYLRQSILKPQADIVAGYEPLMPSFEGQLTENEIIDLIEYIKSLAEEESSDDAGND
jgi:cytochrome c oxidase subunit 2